METKDKLIEKLKELVAFYGEIISGYAVYLHVHNIHESDGNVEKGKRLREEIASLEQIAKEIPAGAEEIPEWITKYDQANYQSSAGKAVRFLIKYIKQVKEALQSNNRINISDKLQSDIWDVCMNLNRKKVAITQARDQIVTLLQSNNLKNE